MLHWNAYVLSTFKTNQHLLAVYTVLCISPWMHNFFLLPSFICPEQIVTSDKSTCLVNAALLHRHSSPRWYSSINGLNFVHIHALLGTAKVHLQQVPDITPTLFKIWCPNHEIWIAISCGPCNMHDLVPDIFKYLKRCDSSSHSSSHTRWTENRSEVWQCHIHS